MQSYERARAQFSQYSNKKIIIDKVRKINGNIAKKRRICNVLQEIRTRSQFVLSCLLVEQHLLTDRKYLESKKFFLPPWTIVIE